MQNSLGCASADQMCHCGSVFIDEDEPHSSYRTGTCETKELSHSQVQSWLHWV